MTLGYSSDESTLAQQLADQCTRLLLQRGRGIYSRTDSWLFRCLAEVSVVLREEADKERVWMNMGELLLVSCHATRCPPDEWWPNVCSGVFYCIGYCTRDSECHGEYASWLLTMMLCCSSVIELNQPCHIIVSIFTSTSTAFREPCHQMIARHSLNTCHAWYGILRSSRLGLQEKTSQHLCSPVVLVACYTAMLDTIATHAEYHDLKTSLVEDIRAICHWGRSRDGNFDAVFSSSLALSRLYTKSLVPCDLATALCLLESYVHLSIHMSDSTMARVSTSADTQSYDKALRNACLYATQHCMTIQGVHVLQSPILEALERMSHEFYISQYDVFNRTKRMNLGVGQSLFDLAIRIIEIVTKQASVLKITSLERMVQCIGYLQLWRISSSSTYRALLRKTLQALPTQPKEAQEVASSLFQDGFQMNDEYVKHPVVLARLQFLLFMLQPCSDALPASLLMDQLAQTCLSLLSSDHTPLSDASNDLLCSILSQKRLDAQEKRRVSLLYIEKSFDAAQTHPEEEEEYIQSWKNRFNRGMSTLASTPDMDYQCVYLEDTLDKCFQLLEKGLSRAATAAFESAAYSLQHMSLENIPNACHQLQTYLSRIQQSECHPECCTRLFRVIQESHDITRVPYLAQHYMEIIGRGGP